MTDDIIPAAPAIDAPAEAATPALPVRTVDFGGTPAAPEPPAPPADEPPAPVESADDLARELLALDAKLRLAGSSIPLLLIELARHNLGGSFVRALHLDDAAEAETVGE